MTMSGPARDDVDLEIERLAGQMAESASRIAKAKTGTVVNADRARIVWGDVLDTDDPPIPWVSEGFRIGPGRPSVFAGEGGSSKTMLAQYLATCVFTGRPFLSFGNVRKGRVLYVDFEQGLRVTKSRFRRFARAYNFCLADYRDSIGYLYRPFFLDAVGKEKRLADLVDGFDLVIVDSARRSAPSLRDNDGEASRPFDIMAGVSEWKGTAFLVTDHASTKRPEGMSRKSMQRGHSSKLDAAGTIYALTKEKGKPTLVTCEREQIEGEFPGDFCFDVRDVKAPYGDEPEPGTAEHRAWRKWGLQIVEFGVEAAKPTPDKPKESSADRAAALEQVAVRLLELIKREPGISSTRLEELAPKMRHKTFLSAMELLQSSTRIANRTGKATRKEWIAK